MKEGLYMRPGIGSVWKFLVTLTLLLCILIMAGCSQKNDSDSVTNITENTLEFGAEYFQQYYTQKAAADTAHDYTHMRTDEINNIVSSTEGMVVDSEELHIEVMGAIFSGNTTEIVLRVTAKNMESLLNDNAQEHLSNYQFADASAMLVMMTLGGDTAEVNYQYTYCDTDAALEANQLLLHYWIINQNALDMDTFSIPLQGFGRISSKNGMTETVYDGSWQVDIAVDPTFDSSEVQEMVQNIQIGNYIFILETVELTPLSCSLRMRCTGDDAYILENQQDIFKTLRESCEQLTINFADGTSLSPEPSEFFVGSDENMPELDGGLLCDEYRISFFMDAPVSVGDIVSLTLCGITLGC